MKNSIMYFLIILVSSILIISAFGQAENKLKMKSATDFVLEDQFEKKQEINFPSDKDIILIFFKMKMGDESYNEVIEWKSQFESFFSDSIEVFLLGIHSNVPGFLKSMVRGFMDDKERILLDWSGDVAEKYGFQDEIRVLHISGNGFIDCIAQENYTEKKFKNFTKTISSSIKKK